MKTTTNKLKQQTTTMKNIVKILTTATVTAIAIFGTTTVSHAQATATAQADAHATIVTPITIVKVNDLEFGNIAVGASSGSVDLDPNGGARTPSGGVTLPAVPGTVNPASFTVSGQAGYIYGITLPSTITIASGANSMTITNINSYPTVAAGGQLGSGGTETLFVGGTLGVAASQAAGTYSTAATFPVTVVYN